MSVTTIIPVWYISGAYGGSERRIFNFRDVWWFLLGEDIFVFWISVGPKPNNSVLLGAWINSNTRLCGRMNLQDRY
ncbi:hypothetical protein HanXRQr2_Chr14g0664411 [Helianthus annuus]|uniref:Uncharacterized protein n=1 Tax=Helianthus annuus TaxID=4232 RepID=A0A9K3EC68_HELAN|nr:hypothetical protein HanXRQr2_Chr14g0664411 [Helianthus annuus]KAJ0842083.1 hypothetical protein HanPSC8_Chr14g0637641 [Helianthus annuus]